MNKNQMIELLRKDVVPALGCTEPVCVALSAANASSMIEGEIVSVDVKVNAGIYKNGMSAGIPNCREVGLTWAAAIGATLKNPAKGLELLADLTPDYLKKASELLANDEVLDAIIDVYEIVIQTSIVEYAVPAVVKSVVSNLELTDLVGDIIAAVDVEGIADEEIYEDLNTIAVILRNVESLDIMGAIFAQEQIGLHDITGYQTLLENVFALNILDHALIPVVEVVVESLLNVDLDDAAMAAIDADSEEQLIIDAVVKALETIKSLDIQYVSEGYQYYVDLVNGIVEDINNAFSYFAEGDYENGIPAMLVTIGTELENVDQDALLGVFESLLSLELIGVIGVEAYNQLVFANFEGDMAVVADLHDYSASDLTEDLLSVVEILRSILDSNIHMMGVTGEFVGEECIDDLENVIKVLFGLNAIEVKEQDLEEILDIFLGELVDLSGVDFDKIDLSNDGQILAGIIAPIYTLVEVVLYEGFSVELFAREEIQIAIADIYDVLLTTSIVEYAVPEVAKSVVTSLEETLDEFTGILISALDIQGLANEEICPDLVKVS